VWLRVGRFAAVCSCHAAVVDAHIFRFRSSNALNFFLITGCLCEAMHQASTSRSSGVPVLANERTFRLATKCLCPSRYDR